MFGGQSSNETKIFFNISIRFVFFLFFRATARDVFATLHVVCDEDLSLSTCTDLFGRQLRRIFETHCIRHYTLQYEYVEPGGNFHRCTYGTRRRHRGHHSSSDDHGDLIRQIV